jgi:phage-related protein
MASDRARKILVVFYRTRSGAEVVRDWLRGLDAADRNAIGQDLMRVQYRWPVGMPLCRALGDGLWEVRSTHGFIKKTRKTPADDLALARKRKREFER